MLSKGLEPLFVGMVVIPKLGAGEQVGAVNHRQVARYEHGAGLFIHDDESVDPFRKGGIA